ncbi:LLM class flavin-dependent oxidoreductase [Zavarzinia sp. CC-PAN008]|uniref:LLM class flavin-dependent oxidoreductase n=1 Tax=Zavarzinia sp. CC-PAN008 TaxID=3243332 RepID=UPI003F74964E
MSKRQMHLVAYLKTSQTFHHHGAWRHPASPLHDLLLPERYEHVARVLEAGFFDACFFEDTSNIFDTHEGKFDAILKGGGQISLLDPVVVLPYLARATKHLGLGITMSTSFYHPFHIARLLGSLDHLSGGRVAWNVITSAQDAEAQNFGMARIGDRDTRYQRAEETVEAALKLWASWDDGALILDKASGTFADPSKVHYANYVGRHVSTRGPLPTPRCPQGHPVIMQAGSSPRGREVGARFAEVIFTIQHDVADMLAYRQDMHRRMAVHGRKPEDCVILPSLDIIVGETDAIAEEKRQYLDSLIDADLAIATVSAHIGVDLSSYDLDKPLDVVGREITVQGVLDAIVSATNSKGLTLREAAHRYATSFMAPQIAGSPTTIADRMQEIFESGACDGFILTPTTFPGMYEDFTRMVVPELQRRGIYRTAYTGKTLRDNLRGIQA